ncbi:iron complex transport system substrate-binding protein [Scopulibacillus daqui]|uniref:Iron complex transport system substrate-binding protein n=2 Tax=Scopulibacillus daqui TaxID=1469162 RepID=A0ABS2Q1L6_9BACL|nr:iron complex transport system substrate-binding protein [Scopulibacillus daqui]
MKKKLLYVSLSLMIILALAGCNSGSKDTASTQDGQSSKDTYTVKHAMGTAKIKGQPKRVVILTNEGTEALLAMGVKPVGAVQSWTGDPWYSQIKDKMKGVKVVGTESDVNLEAIAKLHPDLIIGNKVRQEKIYKQLSEIAPTVFSETLKSDWKKNFKLYAKALDKQEKGKEVIEKYDKRVKSLHGKLGDKVNRTVSLVRFVPQDIRILHKDTFAGNILEQLGFKRPKDQDKNDFAAQHVSKEMIPKMNADYLFYYTYQPAGDNSGAKAEKEFTNTPLWKNLSVVKKGNAHKVDDSVWNTSGGVISANLVLDDIEKYILHKGK